MRRCPWPPLLGQAGPISVQKHAKTAKSVAASHYTPCYAISDKLAFPHQESCRSNCRTESSSFLITYHLSYQTITIDTKNVQGTLTGIFGMISTILVSHPVLTQGKHKAVIKASLGLTLRSTSSAWWQNPNPRCPQTHSNPPAPVGAKGRVFPEALATGSFS